MNGIRAYIASAGIVSPLGHGLARTFTALSANLSAIAGLTLFPLMKGERLPVGQADVPHDPSSPLPRTHALALAAAHEAMAGNPAPPDAIVLGTTTGGILTTEDLLRSGELNPERYRLHGLATVAETLGAKLGVSGPCLTVSTACSSGALAIAVGLALLRAGLARTVLAGGVDSLCRLTYFGFHSLQLVDRNGCHPLDTNRHGMAVAEGAALLLLTIDRPAEALAEIAGAGLSCDAWHPASPHPDGDGAFRAMRAALADAGLAPDEISAINLHGTGTRDNDLAEARAVLRLFPEPPPLSSIKGATGHGLGAAGAIEAVAASLMVSRGLIPANTGLVDPDPALGVRPVTTPLTRPVPTVLSNSLGFGGNNCALAIRQPDATPTPPRPCLPPALFVHGHACLTGAGGTSATRARLADGTRVSGRADLAAISESLPPRLVRRLQRLPRLALALAESARAGLGDSGWPKSIFLGTGWGALSETWNFLARLTESEEQFPSPTDFVGSVHNGPASQVAIHLGATGPNVTASGGDASFEQALFLAWLLGGDEPRLVLGADEGHEAFSPLLDPSSPPGALLADGGGALVLRPDPAGAICGVSRPVMVSSPFVDGLPSLIGSLGGPDRLRPGCAAVLAGIPAAEREQGETRLAHFLQATGITAPVIRFRDWVGQFASASAVAASLAVSFFQHNCLPGSLTGQADRSLDQRPCHILVLGLGRTLSAMEFFRS